MYYRSQCRVISNGSSWMIVDGVNRDIYTNQFTNYGSTTLSGNLYCTGTISVSNGSISDNALTSNVVLLNSMQTISGSKTFSNGLSVSGGSLTFPSGSINDSYLSSNVAFINGSQTFTGNVSFTGASTFNGIFTGTTGTRGYGDNTTALASTAYCDSEVLFPGMASLLSNITLTNQLSNRTFTLGGSTAFTITLPSASGANGVHYTFINTRSIGVASITISSASNIFINNTNNTTSYLLASNITQTIISNGTQWYSYGNSSDITNNNISTTSIINTGNLIQKSSIYMRNNGGDSIYFCNNPDSASLYPHRG